jgi:hypothetical protein
MMKGLHRARKGFLTWWIVSTYGIYAFAICLWGVLELFRSVLFLPGQRFMGLQGTFISEILLFVAFALVTGFMQTSNLQSHMGWHAEHWTRNSIIFGFLACGVIVVLRQFLGVQDNLPLMIMVFIVILTLGQRFSLRHAVGRSWLWVVGYVVIAGVLLFFVFYNNYGVTTSGLFGLMFIPLVQGFFSGRLLLHLFNNYPLYAFTQESPFEEAITEQPNRKPSVWDDAI